MASTLLVALIALLGCTGFGACYNFGLDDGKFPKFGRGMRSDFSLDPEYININSASVGAYPNSVRKMVEKFEDRALGKPDKWLRSSTIPEIAKARRVLGELLNCDEDDLVMIPNTTGGINAVLRNLNFIPGDRILYLSTIYTSIEGIVRYVLDHHHGILSPLVLNITYPMPSHEFLRKFENFVQETHDPRRPVRIAVVDHITSLPTILNPIEKMIQILKRFHIPVVVDAAHAIGQVPIDLKKLDPDFYVADVHKWGMAPCPTAVMYVKKEHHGIIHPAIISQFYRIPSDFQREFWWPGSWDDLNYIAVPYSMEYRKSIGGEERIMNYNNRLARLGGSMVAQILGTRLLQDPDQMASMADVQLPLMNPENPHLSMDWFINLQLTNHPNTFAPVYKHNGHWWARLSAQVFNDITDYQHAAEHLLSLIREANSLA